MTELAQNMHFEEAQKIKENWSAEITNRPQS
jgi:hypothetical protein